MAIDDKWCVVISHESHNHPSQILPNEGAATGIGGTVCDVSCTDDGQGDYGYGLQKLFPIYKYAS